MASRDNFEECADCGRFVHLDDVDAGNGGYYQPGYLCELCAVDYLDKKRRDFDNRERYREQKHTMLADPTSTIRRQSFLGLFEYDYDPKKTPSAACGVIFLLIVLVVACATCGKGESDPSNGNSDSYYPATSDVIYFAKEFVKNGLKAPSTAVFPSSDGEYSVSTLAENTFTVVGYVDAENSFGAKLRSKFVVKLRYSPSEEKWHLIDRYVE